MKYAELLMRWEGQFVDLCEESLAPAGYFFFLVVRIVNDFKRWQKQIGIMIFQKIRQVIHCLTGKEIAFIAETDCSCRLAA